jgi:hypothetical protein
MLPRPFRPPFIPPFRALCFVNAGHSFAKATRTRVHRVSPWSFATFVYAYRISNCRDECIDPDEIRKRVRV